MRIGRPRTLLSLTLVGLGLVTLPLLVAVGNAVLELNELMDESAEAVRASADSTRENERVTQALTNMRRYALQYFALAADAERRANALERYRGAAENLSQSLTAVARQAHPVTVDDELAALGAALGAVNGFLATPEAAQEVSADELEILSASTEENLDVMSASANSIKTIMRDDIADRLAALEDDTRATQTALAWQAAALIPGTFVLVLFFLRLVGRPMRQVDRAIRELGKGDFSHAIAVSGPADIETLGRQLEWLRLRLAESTEEKNRFLRHARAQDAAREYPRGHGAIARRLRRRSRPPAAGGAY